MAHPAWGLLSIRVLLTYYVFPVNLFLQTDNCFSVAMRLNYIMDNPTRSHFCKQTNVIQVFNYATVENFKTAWTYLTSQETALKFMNVIGPFAKKNLRIFCFQKTGCDWTILSSKCPDLRVCTVTSERLF